MSSFQNENEMEGDLGPDNDPQDRPRTPCAAVVRRSEAINDLVGAMAKARGMMETPKRNCKNLFFRSEYADLASLHEVSRDALASNALHVFQPIGRSDEGEVVVVTLLAHASGQWIETTLAAMPAKNDIQGLGACATYLRRYAYGALLQLASEHDDDGNSESGQQDPEAKPVATRPPQKRKDQASAPPPASSTPPPPPPPPDQWANMSELDRSKLLTDFLTYITEHSGDKIILRRAFERFAARGVPHAKLDGAATDIKRMNTDGELAAWLDAQLRSHADAPGEHG